MFHIGKFPITVNTSKARKISALILTILLLAVVIPSFSAYNSMSDYGIGFYIFSIFAALVTSLLLAFNPRLSKKAERIFSLVIFILLPVVSITMTEALNSKFVYDFSVKNFFFNYIFYLLFYIAFYAITGSYRLTIIIFNSIIYPLAMANNIIYKFRGTVFVPSDFMGITTAANVIGTYKFEITGQIASSAVLLAFLIVAGINLRTPAKTGKNRIRKIVGRSSCGAVALITALVFFFTDFFGIHGIAPDFWNQTRGYHNSGFLTNFFLNTKYLYYSKPSGYNAENIEGIVKEGIEKTGEFSIPSDTDISEDDADITETDGEKYSGGLPNIICIMNESFSDLKVLGDFSTNIEYMPFFKSVSENSIHGNLYVPVNGAGTSNTEFEFLTGCSTSFLPSGSNAYMTYVKNQIPSLVSTAINNGYSTRAIHPYYSSGWNRTSVYNLMGFSQFCSLGSFIPVSIMRNYQLNGFDPNYLNSLVEQQYPGKNLLVRQYVGDSYNYRAIISDYSKRDITKPYFLFNVTMQNHGGYTTKCVNFNEEVKVTSTSYEYPETNQYLSLIKKSDDAFKELIEYFSNVSEPTIICMFGDHQPNIEDEFIEEIMGKSLEDLTDEEDQKRYITPFIIWSNYQTNSEYIDKLSVNYLSTYVLNTAGIEMPLYNKYLYSISKTLPVIDNVGCIDKDNGYYSNGSKSNYSSVLDNYEKIQYNLLFDIKDRKNEIFDFHPIETDNTED